MPSTPSCPHGCQTSSSPSRNTNASLSGCKTQPPPESWWQDRHARMLSSFWESSHWAGTRGMYLTECYPLLKYSRKIHTPNEIKDQGWGLLETSICMSSLTTWHQILFQEESLQNLCLNPRQGGFFFVFSIKEGWLNILKRWGPL